MQSLKLRSAIPQASRVPGRRAVRVMRIHACRCSSEEIETLTQVHSTSPHSWWHATDACKIKRLPFSSTSMVTSCSAHVSVLTSVNVLRTAEIIAHLATQNSWKGTTGRNASGKVSKAGCHVALYKHKYGAGEVGAGEVGKDAPCCEGRHCTSCSTDCSPPIHR